MQRYHHSTIIWVSKLVFNQLIIIIDNHAGINGMCIMLICTQQHIVILLFEIIHFFNYTASLHVWIRKFIPISCNISKLNYTSGNTSFGKQNYHHFSCRLKPKEHSTRALTLEHFWFERSGLKADQCLPLVSIQITAN